MTPKPLNDREKAYLEQAIPKLQGLVDDYPKPQPAAPGKAKFHGLAFLGLGLFGASWLGTAALIAAVALAVFAVVRYLIKKSQGAPAVRKAAQHEPPAALERYRRLELAAGKIANSVAGGSFRSVFIGAGGTDFAESKPYAGEGLRDVDWKTSAKQGELYAKKYELEKDMPLLVLADLSRSADFGTRATRKRRVIEEAAALLALAAAGSNLRVGLVIMTDTVEAYIPPQSGMNHAREIMRRLLSFEPKGAGTDLKPGISLAIKELRSRAMVALVSDFIAPDFKGVLAALSSRHDLRAIRVSDPAELEPLPSAGLVLVKDAETGETRLVDTSEARFRADHVALLAREEARRQAAFSEARVRPITLSTEGDPLEILTSSLSPKRKGQ
jgi:hypothetical protein